MDGGRGGCNEMHCVYAAGAFLVKCSERCLSESRDLSDLTELQETPKVVERACLMFTFMCFYKDFVLI